MGSLTFQEVSGNFSNLKNLWKNFNFPTFNCPSVKIWCCCLAKATLFRLQARGLMPGIGISWIACFFCFTWMRMMLYHKFQEHLQAAHILVYFLHSCFFIRFPKFNFFVVSRSWKGKSRLRGVRGPVWSWLKATSIVQVQQASWRLAVEAP